MLYIYVIYMYMYIIKEIHIFIDKRPLFELFFYETCCCLAASK